MLGIDSLGAPVLLGLMALRCGVPLLGIWLLGTALKRIVPFPSETESRRQVAEVKENNSAMAGDVALPLT